MTLQTAHAYVEAYLIPAQLILALLGMGATLSVSQLTDVFRNPRGLALGLTLQWLYVPALAVLFIQLFDLSAGWAIGLCLVAAVPGGAFSNLLTFLARGNTPLSIAVTTASTALCMVTVPVVLRVIASSLLPAEFEFPVGRAMIEIFAYLLVPLTLGMVIHRNWPRASAAVAKWGIRGAMLMLAAIIASSLGSGRIKVLEYGLLPPLIILAFGVTLAISVPALSRLVRRPADDAVALGIEVTVRNIGLALLLIHFFFPGREEQGHILYTCLFFSGASGPIVLPMVILHRFQRGRATLRP